MLDDIILTQADLIGRPATEDRPAERGILPIGRSTLWRMRREGRFPAPIRIGRNRIGWRSSAFKRWLDERPELDVRPLQEKSA